MVPGRIFYLCPDLRSPVGGVKQIYRHVEILDSAGFDATVLHHERDPGILWFESRARAGCISDFVLSGDDWLAVPEVCGPDIHRMWEPARLVIFNQNAYYTFLGYPTDDSPVDSPYRHPRVEAVITNSDDGKAYLEYAFEKPVHLIRYGLPELFAFEEAKARRIAFMPRKRPDDAAQVINILRCRGKLDGWDIQPIENASERDVAGRLGRSAVFMAFGEPEGLGLPPAEAIACGCVVVGYHGQGGKDYMVRGLKSVHPVEVGDIRRFETLVESAIGGFNRKGDRYRLSARRKASRFIREKYSMERERASVVSFWGEMLSGERPGREQYPG